MPIYEYRCEGCGEVAELLRSRAEAAPACPSCGRAGMVKIVSGFATAGGAQGRHPSRVGQATATITVMSMGTTTTITTRRPRGRD